MCLERNKASSRKLWGIESVGELKAQESTRGIESVGELVRFGMCEVNGIFKKLNGCLQFQIVFLLSYFS